MAQNNLSETSINDNRLLRLDNNANNINDSKTHITSPISKTHIASPISKHDYQNDDNIFFFTSVQCF